MLRKWSALVVPLAGLALVAVPWHAPAEGVPEKVVERNVARPAQKEPDRPIDVPRPVEKRPGALPITGKAVAFLAPLDVAMERVMLRHGIPGAALAITKDGKLVFAKGYGWANYENTEVATPETLFGLASVSKCFTALAILKLVEEKKLSLDQSAFAILKHLRPPRGAVVDPRLAKITIRHLLNHSGGWDRNRSGDPINWSWQVAQRLGVRMPINEDHLIRFMLGARLDFDPGSNAVYSNFGYIMLGQIVAQVTGQSYEEYVRESVMEPMGIRGARLHDREGRYFQGESRRYNPGLLRAMPPYNMPWTDASGGWAASAVDLARFMTALDGSRGKPFLGPALMKEMLAPPPAPLKPRPDGTYFGLGWDVVQQLRLGHGYLKVGSFPGVRASLKHRVDGINAIVLFNAVMEPDPLDMRIVNEATHEIQEVLLGVKEWPKVDLFKGYR
jgi:N-acyl-D-amino-acid deacylase